LYYLNLCNNDNLEINSLLPLILLEHSNNKKTCISVDNEDQLEKLRKNISKHSMVKSARKR
jgi:hypothetical protein